MADTGAAGAGEKGVIREQEAGISLLNEESVAQVSLPDLPPNTSLVVSLAMQPRQDVIQGFVTGRQDRQLQVSTEVGPGPTLPDRLAN